MTGMFWRLATGWIDQSDGTHCAEFIHVGNGKSRVVRLCPTLYPCPVTRRDAILQQLLKIQARQAPVEVLVVDAVALPTPD